MEKKITKTQKKVNYLESDENYRKAKRLLDGCYMLHSIVCSWFDESEDYLHKAGALCFDFKHEFLAGKRAMERFEKRLQMGVKEEFKKDFLMDYCELEPELRKVFNLDKYIDGVAGDVKEGVE